MIAAQAATIVLAAIAAVQAIALAIIAAVVTMQRSHEQTKRDVARGADPPQRKADAPNRGAGRLPGD